MRGRGRGAAVGLVAALAVVACAGEPSREPPPAFTDDDLPELSGDDPPELECVAEGFPCTWAEVDTSAVRLGIEVAERGLDVLVGGGDIAAVVALLEAEPSVTSIMADDRVARFRVEGGRPLWLADRNALPAGRRGVPGAAPAGIRTRLATQASGAAAGKPHRRALILEPFRWSWGTAESDHLNYVLMDDDSSVRAYKCAGCVTHTYNDFPRTKNPPAQDPGSLVEYRVTLDDFKNWHEYDLVHVSTHGLMLCAEDSAAAMASCRTALYTGLTLEKPDSLSTTPFLGGDGADYEVLHGATDPGIEFVVAPPSGHCASRVNWNFTTDEQRAQHLCGNESVLDQVVTDDFFLTHYRVPARDTLIFLNACESALDPQRSLVKILQQGGRTAVLGWTIAVPPDWARMVADTFYTYFLRQGGGSGGLGPGGATLANAYDSVRAKVELYKVTDLEVTPPGGVPLSPAAAPVASPPALEPLQTKGPRSFRGRELVALLRPDNLEELEDSSDVWIRGEPDDGRPDSVDLTLEIIGLDDLDETEGMELRVSVDGVSASTSYSIEDPVGNGVYRVRGPIDLGVDAPGEPVDLEIWTDLPDGSRTRWLYEDIRLEGASWTLTVSGGTRAGSYRGPTAAGLGAEAPDGVGSVVLHGADGDPRYAFVELRPRRPFSGPGTYRTDGGCEVEISFFRMADAFATGDIPDDPALCSGHGDAPYPPPATVTITSLTDTWIEGRVTGTFYVTTPVHEPTRRADVQVRFRAPRCDGPGVTDPRCRF